MKYRTRVATLVLSALAAGCGGGNPSSGGALPQSAQQPASDTAAAFTANRSAYTITRTSTGFTVTDKSTGSATHLASVASIRFADVTVTPGIVQRAAAVAAADVDKLIELYIAFFNRVPDAEGLDYWIGQYRAGASLVQICESFYAAAVQYSDLTGYSATMSNADFVRVIYRNVLGRSGTTAPPDADVQYWAGELASGRASKGSLVKTMLESAHSFTGHATWGWVTALLDNKIAVGKQFAVTQALNYNSPSESITRTMSIASAVTSSDTSAALSRIGNSEAAYVSDGSSTFPLMRAAHMYSNYGENVRGVKPALTDAPQSLTASAVAVNVFRSSFSEGGSTVAVDMAVVKLTGVKVGGVAYAQAAFTFGRRSDNGELSMDFNPSHEPSLAAIAGFGGSVHLAVAADGKSANQWELVKVRGAARDYIAAVVTHAETLLAAGAFTISPGAGFDRTTLAQALARFRAGIQTDDSAYFNYLRDKNIEWLALTVPVFYGDLSDPRVYLKYRPLGNIDSGASFTFDDEDLAYFLAKARKAGFKIMLGLELSPVHMDVSTSDPTCQKANYKPNRWLLGQPTVAPSDPMQACMNPTYWWWNPAHADHAKNTAIFWQTYTEVAVKYAKIAQQAGVEMYAFATEQDNLVRTRAGAAPYNNHFKPQLQALISAVRSSYGGLLTYDQQHQTMTNPEMFAGGAGNREAFAGVFEDLGLDVVGTSAYFQLTATPPGRVLSVAEFEAAWEPIFKNHLVPRQAANPGKPLVFTEMGYTDDVASPALQGANLGQPEPPFTGGVSPGQQQQQNIFQAFFNVNARYNNLVRGAFIWGVSHISPYDCNNIVFGIYCKASADTIQQVYGTWKTAP